MKKHHWKRYLSVLCAVTLLLSLVCFNGSIDVSAAASATLGPEPPTCTWFTTSTVKSVKQESDTFVINTAVDIGKNESGDDANFGDINIGIGDLMGYVYNVNMYITFPVEGGFRLRLSEDASKSGFFNPSALSAITYSTLDDGTIVMYGTGDTVLYYKQTATGFTLSVGDKNGKKSLTFTDDDIYLGYNNSSQLVRTKMTLPLAADEAIYNGSERFNDVNQVGHVFSLRNLDAAYHGSSTPSETHTDSYINVPIFHSSEGYSIWHNVTYSGTADVGVEDSGAYTVDFYGGKLDFYVWNGTILENIKKYTAITGTSYVPPKWAFGYWLGAQAVPWRTNQDTGVSYADNSDEAIQQAYDNLVEMFEGYEAMGITDIAAVYGEGLNSTTNADAYAYVNSKGSRMLMWFSPQGYSSTAHMRKLLPGVASVNYPLPLNIANPVAGNFLGTFVDFSHPNAVAHIKGFFNGGTGVASITSLKFWDNGLKGAMIDYGEWLRDDTVLYNGLNGDEMHNLISYYYAKAQVEAWDSYYPDHDYVLFERSGVAGSQKLVANFTGDQAASWEGLKDQIHGILSMSTGGFNIVGGDLGGFQGQPSNELYTRWVGFSTFSPLMRAHGQIKNPWKKGSVAKNSFPTYYWLRMNMQDLLYSASVDAHLNATPMAMPLGVAYQGQANVKDVNDEYLFCNSFLVAPVTSPDVSSREVWLPEGNWYDLWSYKRIEGNTTITADAPVSTIPAYLKSGAAVAVELPDTMEPMTSMEGKTKYKALLVTPADNLTSTPVYTSVEEAPIVYTSRYVSTNTYTLSASSASNRRMLVAYGTNATAVKVDGVELTALNSVPNITSDASGYYVDGEGRTFVLAPEGWSTVIINHAETTSTEVGLVASGANAVGKTTDGDLNTAYTIPVTVSVGVGSGAAVTGTWTGSLAYAAPAKYFAISWGTIYPSSYTVEAYNGSAWTTVATVTKGKSGTTRFTVPASLQGVVLTQVRISNVVSSSETESAVLNSVHAVRDVDTVLEYSLEKAALVDSIVLYWGEECMTDYTLSVSADGANWTTAKQQVAGYGATERVYFDEPTAVAYIRLSGMTESTENTAPTLREVKCFASSVGDITNSDFSATVSGHLGYENGKYPGGQSWVAYSNSALTTEQKTAFKTYLESKFDFTYSDTSSFTTLKAVENSTSYWSVSGLFGNQFLQFKRGTTYNSFDATRMFFMIPKDENGNKLVAEDFTVRFLARFESTTGGAVVFAFRQGVAGRIYNNGLLTDQGYIKISPQNVQVYNGNTGKTVTTVHTYNEGLLATNDNFRNVRVTLSVKGDYLHYMLVPENNRIATVSGSVKLDVKGAGYMALGIANKSVSLALPTIKISEMDASAFTSTANGMLGYNTTVAGKYPDGNPYGSYSSAGISTQLKNELTAYMDGKYDFYYTDYSGSRTFVKNSVRSATKGFTLSALYANSFLQMSTANGGVSNLESTELRQLTALVPKDVNGTPITIKNFKATFDIRFERTYGALVLAFRQDTPAGFFTASGVNAAQTYIKFSPDNIVLYDRGTTTTLHTYGTEKPKSNAYNQDFRVTVKVIDGTFSYTIAPLSAKATVPAVSGTATISNSNSGYMALAMACAYNGFSPLSVEPLDANNDARYPIITTDKTVANGGFTVSRVTDTADANGYYKYHLTVNADEGYELKAGSLIVTDANGNEQVPVNSTFQTNGQGKTFTFYAKNDTVVNGHFFRPNKTIINAAAVGTSYNTEKGGLRFVYRIQRKVEGGKEYILLDNVWTEIVDYGMLIAVDYVVGNRRLDVELAETNPYVQKHSAKQLERYYDSTDEYVDICMQVINMHTTAAYRKLDMVSNAYVQLADGTYLYANGYTTNYVEAGGPAA